MGALPIAAELVPHIRARVAMPGPRADMDVCSLTSRWLRARAGTRGATEVLRAGQIVEVSRDRQIMQPAAL